MRHAIVMVAVLVCSFVAGPPAARADSTLWSTGYYPGWMQDYLPPSEVDFGALTHVIHFAAIPRTDGTLDTSTNVLPAAYSADIVSRGHAAGVKVLISIGGENSASGFRGATSATKLSTFIANVVDLMTSRGYDGVDVDWEPLAATDIVAYTALIDGLHSAVNGMNPRPLLTVAVASQPALIFSVQDEIDQVNLMTYSLSGPWGGWVTWFNAPLYDGGYRFPSTGGLVPSTDGMLGTFLAAGVAPAKLGIGVSFYGYLWSGGNGTPTGGASAPRQGWTTAPTTYQLPYYSIMDNYSLSPYQYVWDGAAHAGYYRLDQSGSTNDKFVSFDDEPALGEKVEYARSKGIGGVMIWELAGGYRANQSAGNRDPLLQAVKAALAPPSNTPTPAPTTPTPAPTPTPTAVPSCSYSISPAAQSFTWKSSSASSAVTTTAACAWTAASSASWLTVTSGASGTGSGTVRYTAAMNPGASRTATVSIAGQTVTITQSGKR